MLVLMIVPLVFMSTTNAIVVASAALAGIAVILGWLRFATQAPLRSRIAELEARSSAKEQAREKVEDDLRRESGRVAELTAALSAAKQDFANLKLGRPGVVLKSEIDEALDAALTAVDVREGSVLVRAPSADPHLLFLAVAGPAADRIRKTRVPIDRGIAARVISTGICHNTGDPQADENFYDAVDEKADRETRALLTIPITCDGRTVGVLQFLNKLGGFSEADEEIGTDSARMLAPLVRRFIDRPEHFESLGFAWRDDLSSATVLFSDLTASSSLLERMNVASAVDCINEYLETQCESAMRHGGTIDNYLGDGVMLRFGPARNVALDGQTRAALAAAADMTDAFERVKRGWLAADLPVDPIFVRIGIASGSLYETRVGHPALPRLTVIGETVNRASRACEEAPRDRSVIVVDDETLKLLPKDWSLVRELKHGTEVQPPAR